MNLYQISYKKNATKLTKNIVNNASFPRADRAKRGTREKKAYKQLTTFLTRPLKQDEKNAYT